ncbi:MAG TPA: FAD-binding oxidoreductase, partial [Rhodothermales bacterium]|nr:FAD-binding oxidoreductase [Rhodothermales bacterium]
MNTQVAPAQGGHEPYAKPTSMGGTVKWTDTPRTRAKFEGDREALAAELRKHVNGEVRFDSASQALYAADASNYRQVPIGVVIPKDVDSVVATVDICRKHGAPIVNRGRGTSLAGQTVNAAVCIVFDKYLNEIIEIDPDNRVARVQPGCRLDDLRDQAEKFNLTFGPDPSTHAWCSFGGMIGNNSCGVHSQMAGRTEDNIYELDVLTYDGARMKVGATSDDELERIVRGGGRRGEIYGKMRDLRDQYAAEIRRRYPNIPRRVSGYNLPELLPENGFQVARALVGTEGTCVTVLEATIRLIDSPPKRVLVVFGYEDIYSAGDHVPELNTFTGRGLVGLEAMDEKLIRFMRWQGIHTDYLHLLPAGGGFLIAEFGAETVDDAVGIARKCMDMVKGKDGSKTPDMRLYTDPVVEEHLMKIREAGLGATAHVRGLSWPGWEDSAVPPDRIGDYLRDLQKLYEKYGYDASLYGH